MSIQIEGNASLAQEVLAQIQLWDDAISHADLARLSSYCADQISMFDISSQLQGIEAYKAAWEKYSAFLMQGVQIYRRDMKLNVNDNLAILDCQTKVQPAVLLEKLHMPWCRTTLCLQKQQGMWRVIHQHISMPVDISTGQAIILKDQVKLRLVV